jgi:thiamine-phosphate pyrophosphorylase
VDRHAIVHFSPDVYVIVDQNLADSRSLNLEKLVEEICTAGAGAIQFRAKDFSKARYYQQVQYLLPITRSYNIPLFVNDHVDVALATSADGIHVGQNDLPLDATQKLLPQGMILGVSTHSLPQAALAAQAKPGYIAFGPVFPTTTKADPDPVVGLESVRKVKQLLAPIPLIAIGGIHAGNAEQVICSGADAVAVASAVVLAKEPAAAVSSLKESVRRGKAGRGKES